MVLCDEDHMELFWVVAVFKKYKKLQCVLFLEHIMMYSLVISQLDNLYLF